MYSDSLFAQDEQNEDLAEQFADHSITDLRFNLLKLVQKNVVYSYCESLIVEDINYSEETIAQIMDYCQERNKALLYDLLPFEVLLQLKKAKSDLRKCTYDRQAIINIILNLILENTLLHSRLSKFAYH